MCWGLLDVVGGRNRDARKQPSGLKWSQTNQNFKRSGVQYTLPHMFFMIECLSMRSTSAESLDDKHNRIIHVPTSNKTTDIAFQRYIAAVLRTVHQKTQDVRADFFETQM